jgi:hypothetical protein
MGLYRTLRTGRIRDVLAAACAAAIGVVAASTATAANQPLQASVTSNGHLVLANVTGRLVTRLRAGTYVIQVHDMSRKQNFHLLSRGANVDRRSGLRFVGVLTWKLTLRQGKYVYFSDRKPSVRVSFRVT